MPDAAVHLVRVGRGPARRYAVWQGDTWVGDVWPQVRTEVRWNRGGKTTNKTHPSKQVTYWKTTGSTEDHHTRRDAVAELLRMRRDGD